MKKQEFQDNNSISCAETVDTGQPCLMVFHHTVSSFQYFEKKKKKSNSIIGGLSKQHEKVTNYSYHSNHKEFKNTKYILISLLF
jgi:hypothetical protein